MLCLLPGGPSKCPRAFCSRVIVILSVVFAAEVVELGQSANVPQQYIDGYTTNTYWIKDDLLSYDKLTYEFGHSLNESDYINIGTAITLDWNTKHGNIGRQVSRGYRLFFDWLNTQGGVSVNGKKYPVKLTFIDDGSSADRVEEITRFLVEDRKVRHLLAPFGSTFTERAARVINESDAVMVAPCAASTKVFKDRPRVFGTNSPTSYFLVSAMEALSAKNATTVAFVQESASFTRGVCKQVQPLADKHGMQVLFNATVEDDANISVVRTAIREMKEHDPDVVIGCVYAKVCHRALEALSIEDFSPKAIVMTVCVTASGFFETAVRRNVPLGTFVMGVAPWVPSIQLQSQLTSWSASTFVKEFQTSYQEEAVPYQAASAFASASALVRGMEIAGSFEPEKVAEALRNMDETSVFGRTAFDDQGQCRNNFLTVQMGVQGTVAVVAPQNQVQEPLLYPKPRWTGIPCLNSNPLVIGRRGLQPNGSCMQCGPNLIAVFKPELGYRVCERFICPKGQRDVIFVQDRTEDGPEANRRRGSSNRAGVYCELCHRGHFGERTGATQCESCAAGTYQDMQGQTACQACVPGKYASSRGSTACIPCPSNFYSDENSSSQCTKCPEGGICGSDANGLFSNFTNDEGYFTFVPPGTAYREAKLYRCIHTGKNGVGSSCVPGGCMRDEEGRVTAHGPFCGLCKPGFGRKRLGRECVKCGSLAQTIVVCVGSVLCLLLVASAMFLLVLMTDLTRPRNMKAIICKQVLNYIGISQVVFSQVSLRIPLDFGFATESLAWLRVFGAGGTAPFASQSADCLAEHLLGEHNSWRAYCLMGLVSVPLWAATCVLIFVIHRMYCKYCVHKTPPRRSRLMTLLIINLFVIHPPNTELSLRAFSCHYFDQPRLAFDTTVICNNEEHQPWQLVSFIGFVVYSLGIPLVTFLLLRSYNRAGKLQNRKTINTLGFLYTGFEPQYYYFESVFMLRKVLYQLVGRGHIPGFESEQQDATRLFSCMAMLILATMFLALHMACEPYDNRSYFTLDKVESASLWAILVTLLVQVTVIVSEESFVFSNQNPAKEAARDLRDLICAIIVIFVHCRFFCVTFVLMFRRNLQPMLNMKYLEYGDVVVEKTGLGLEGLSGAARKSLTVMFGELAQIFVDAQGAVSCMEFSAALQYMCVDTMYHRLRDRYVNTGAALKDEEIYLKKLEKTNWKDRLELHIAAISHVLTKFISKKVKRIQKTMSHAHDRLAGVSRSQVIKETRERQMERKQEILEELRRLKQFNAETFQHCIGEKFAVEDLHLSMLRIAKELQKQKSKGQDGLAKQFTKKMEGVANQSQPPKSQADSDDEEDSPAYASTATDIAQRHSSGTIVTGGAGTTSRAVHHETTRKTFASARTGAEQSKFPECPEVDTSPEELSEPPSLSKGQETETTLRSLKIKAAQLQEKHDRERARRDHRIQEQQKQVEMYEMQLRLEPMDDDGNLRKLDMNKRGSFIVEEGTHHRSSISVYEQETQHCADCGAVAVTKMMIKQDKDGSGGKERSVKARFCWKCGQELKGTWKDIQLHGLRYQRANVMVRNEELQDELPKMQSQLEELMTKVQNQKSELEHNRVEMQAFGDAWQKNEEHLKEIQREGKELLAAKELWTEKSEQAEDREYAARVELDSRRYELQAGKKTAQRPKRKAALEPPAAASNVTQPQESQQQKEGPSFLSWFS